MAEIYAGINGKIYSAGRKIGHGGEGTVFEAIENNNLVLKIYTEALSSDKSEKLDFMTTFANTELQKFAAWPVDVLKDKHNKVSGFVMRKLEGYVPLHNLFSPLDRKKLFPDKGYNFLVHVARNLAIAFFKIHEAGIIVGDVNEANVLVNSAGLVALIDCDSFQIKNGNRYHFCEVGIPRYTPPELLERGSFDNAVRTTNTDNFSLATLIFQLLFLGRAPFTGISPNNQEVEEDTAIKTREFAYSLQRHNKKLLPAKNSLEIRGLTDGIIKLFHAAFEETTSRPQASNWAYELDVLNKELVQCGRSKIHFYPKKMVNCPWCEFRDKNNIMYFLDDSYLKAVPELNNIEQFVNGFKLEDLRIKKLTETYVGPNLTAAPIDPRFIRYKHLNRVVIMILILATLLLSVSVNWGISVVGGVIMLIFNTLSPSQRKLKEELNRRQTTYNTLKESLQTIIKQHNTPNDLKTYNHTAHKVTNYIESFRRLPAEYATAKKKVEEKHYRLKFIKYLQQFDVRYYQIPSFGSAKKLLIYNNGIRTAADIDKLNTIKISGIGPKNIQILFDWQRHIGASFTYSPDINAINYDISVAANELKNRRQKLEVEIKSEYKSLLAIKANILTTVNGLEQQYQSVLPQTHKAELDLKAFQSLIK